MATTELAGLRNSSPADIELAKQTLKGKVNRQNGESWRRLEERTKALYYLGRTNEDFSSQVDAVSADQVLSAIDAALKSPLTFLAQGGEVNTLPSYDKIASRFN